MHSWVFRHRARLRVIYGLGPAPALPSVEAPAEQPAEPAPEPLAEDAEEHSSSRKMRTRKHRLTPGTLARRGRWVLFAPMPRRVV
jgi:hypothetical protein